jgi:hypothetical protein
MGETFVLYIQSGCQQPLLQGDGIPNKLLFSGINILPPVIRSSGELLELAIGPFSGKRLCCVFNLDVSEHFYRASSNNIQWGKLPNEPFSGR